MSLKGNSLVNTVIKDIVNSQTQTIKLSKLPECINRPNLSLSFTWRITSWEGEFSLAM